MAKPAQYTQCRFSDIINNKVYEHINDKYKTEQVPDNVNKYVTDRKDDEYMVTLPDDFKGIPCLSERDEVTKLLNSIHQDMLKYSYIDITLLPKLLETLNYSYDKNVNLLNFMKENCTVDYYICVTLHLYALNALLKKKVFFEMLRNEFDKKRIPFDAHVNSMKRLVNKCVDQGIDFKVFLEDPYEHFLKLDTSSTKLFNIIDMLACDCSLSIRLLGVARFILHVNESVNKNTRMHLDEALNECSKTTSYKDVKTLRAEEKVHIWKDAGIMKFFTIKGTRNVALKETFTMEKDLSEYFRILCKKRCKELPNFNKYEDFTKLTNEQQQAAINAFSCGISCLTGGPGHGKTETIKCIQHICSKSNLRIMITAPTGRASSQLDDGKTCHKVINTKKLEKPNIVIIDETSMLDLEVCYSFFKKLRFNTTLNILFVGDVNQLPSIGCGDILRDLIYGCNNMIKVVTLTKNFRNNNSIGNLANHIANNRIPSNWNDYEDVTFIKYSQESLYDQVIELYDKILGVPLKLDRRQLNLQILSPYNESVKEINTLIHNHISPNFTKPIKGEKLMGCKNKYEEDAEKPVLANGEMCFFEEEDGNVYHINVLEEKKVIAKDAIVLGHCITIHKSQGGQYENVILIIPSGSSPYFANKSLVYTAVTRAKKHVYVISDTETLRRCVKQEREPRKTCLGYLMMSQA